LESGIWDLESGVSQPLGHDEGGAEMNDEEIEIEIGADGKVVVRTIGIKGPRCLDVAEAIAQIVGREESRRLTEEYHEVGIQSHSHVEQQVRRFGG
jgi:hypothetical protein